MNGAIKVVDAARQGQRIDNFLLAQLKGVPKGLIYRLLRTGKIRVNGKRVKQTYRLQTDDEVKLPIIETVKREKANISDTLKVQIERSILYEDQQLLCINKPAGLAVHPGTNISYGVIEILRALRPNVRFLELVHRLDRETSGCLLIAKQKTTLNELHDLLRNNAINKIYLLLVKGIWNHGEKIVDTPLQTRGKDFTRKVHKNTWKEAYTRFKPIQYYEGFTLLEAHIKTGRTHQIRIHATETGFPIVGDTKYGDFAFNRKCKKMGLVHMFLHAIELSFKLPNSTQAYSIKAPLPDELKAFIHGLDS